jgi:hypothetical protein
MDVNDTIALTVQVQSTVTDTTKCKVRPYRTELGKHGFDVSFPESILNSLTLAYQCPWAFLTNKQIKRMFNN